MKITQADVIRDGERELIDIITGDLDWRQIETILEQKYRLRLSDGQAAYRRGDIVVHNNQVAYKLEFETTVRLAVMFDRQGECVDVLAEAVDPAPIERSRPAVSADDTDGFFEQPMPASGGGQGALVADIAGMIADINKS